MYFIKSTLKFPFIPLQRFPILRDLKAEDLMAFPDEATKRRHFLPKYTRWGKTCYYLISLYPIGPKTP